MWITFVCLLFKNLFVPPSLRYCPFLSIPQQYRFAQIILVYNKTFSSMTFFKRVLISSSNIRNYYMLYFNFSLFFLSVRLSDFLYVCLIIVYLSVCLIVLLSKSLLVCLSVCLSISFLIVNCFASMDSLAFNNH